MQGLLNARVNYMISIKVIQAKSCARPPVADVCKRSGRFLTPTRPLRHRSRDISKATPKYHPVYTTINKNKNIMLFNLSRLFSLNIYEKVIKLLFFNTIILRYKKFLAYKSLKSTYKINKRRPNITFIVVVVVSRSHQNSKAQNAQKSHNHFNC